LRTSLRKSSQYENFFPSMETDCALRATFSQERLPGDAWFPHQLTRTIFWISHMKWNNPRPGIIQENLPSAVSSEFLRALAERILM